MDHDFLQEEELSVDTLAKIFKRAFIKTSVDEDGDIVAVWSDARIWVILDEKRKFISFLMRYGFKEDANESLKLELVNTMNSNYLLTRFKANGKTLSADYWLSYEEGILPYQLINSFKRFANIVPEAVSKHDKDDLLK